MTVEWSADAVADLDRFADFLHRHHPELARVVAREIIEKTNILRERPLLGRPLAGHAQYRQIVFAGSQRRLCHSIPDRRRARRHPARFPRARSADVIRRQRGNTRTMIFGAEHLVWYCSQFFVMEPGDIIITGTPPGVGLGMKPRRCS